MVMETRILLFGVFRGMTLVLGTLEVVAERERIEEEHSGHEHLQADQQVLDSLLE